MQGSDINVYADQLNIETPEQVDLRFPIAGLGSRFLAVLLDVLIVAAVYLVVGLVVYITAVSGNTTPAETTKPDTMAKWLIAGFIFINFVLNWGYYTLFETFWNGQTPGKRVMKIRVIKDSGRSITLFEAMARNLIRVVDALPGAYLVGVITMMCNRRNKRLGDYAAGTIVIHESRQEQPLLGHVSRTFTAGVYPEAGAGQSFMPQAREERERGVQELPADAVARLGPGDLHVIETFFSRALDLTVEQREALGERVGATMLGKMGIAKPEGMGTERMLELIAWKMRGQGR